MADTDGEWMEALSNMGEEGPPDPRPIEVPPDLRTSWHAYSRFLAASGGFDCCFGILTFEKTIMLGMGYSLGWALQRGVFDPMVKAWDSLAKRSIENVCGLWSGSFASDEAHNRFFVVDWELFPSVSPKHGYAKARVMIDADDARKYGAICMDDAPFFPPWRMPE
jgi:hypothetical protein